MHNSSSHHFSSERRWDIWFSARYIVHRVQNECVWLLQVRASAKSISHVRPGGPRRGGFSFVCNTNYNLIWDYVLWSNSICFQMPYLREYTGRHTPPRVHPICDLYFYIHIYIYFVTHVHTHTRSSSIVSCRAIGLGAGKQIKGRDEKRTDDDVGKRCDANTEKHKTPYITEKRAHEKYEK